MDKVKSFVKHALITKKTLVLVTGVFDFLHREHKIFLSKAKQAGDLLIVGIESDQRVKELKGINRPINDEKKRQLKLESLAIADLVFILPQKFNLSQDHLALLKLINPQILAVSSNTPNLANKRQLMKKVGGEVRVVHSYNPQISTTKILDKIDR